GIGDADVARPRIGGGLRGGRGGGCRRLGEARADTNKGQSNDGDNGESGGHSHGGTTRPHKQYTEKNSRGRHHEKKSGPGAPSAPCENFQLRLYLEYSVSSVVVALLIAVTPPPAPIPEPLTSPISAFDSAFTIPEPLTSQ